VSAGGCNVHRHFTVVVVALVLGGCASSHVIVGTVRPPISPEAVTIYLTPPPNYEQVALIDASSRGSFAVGDQHKMDKAIARLKAEAAKLGANGVLLKGTGAVASGSVGAGGGGASGSGHGVTFGGIGISGDLTSKVANGVAIYVPDH
jgi:hypothetical protein